MGDGCVSTRGQDTREDVTVTGHGIRDRYPGFDLEAAFHVDDAASIRP